MLKQNTTLIALLFLICSFAPKTVNQPILDNFKSNFPEAENVYWLENNVLSQVNFILRGDRFRILYLNDDASIIEVYRYSTNNILPAFIKLKLKSKYPIQEVYGVEETMSKDVVSYRITLQDKDHWYFILSDEFGKIHEQQKLNKQ